MMRAALVLTVALWVVAARDASAQSCVKTCAAGAARDARGCCLGVKPAPIKPAPVKPAPVKPAPVKPKVVTPTGPLSCPDGEHASAGHCCRSDWEWQAATKRCACSAARCSKDADKDGISDGDDLCPAAPEDADGFEDQDGCPDPDNDQDRILDAVDKCPSEPENYNGLEDEDGCPDRGRVVVTETTLTIIDHVYFTSRSTTLTPTATQVLDAVVATLQGNPDITSLGIQGHSDRAEPNGVELSQQRADAVRSYLVEHGVAPGRLFAQGVAATSPAGRGRSRAAQAKNRRVEFIIAKRADP